MRAKHGGRAVLRGLNEFILPYTALRDRGPAEAFTGDDTAVHRINPATSPTLEPGFPVAGATDVAGACTLAKAAFACFRETSLADRAASLVVIADEVMVLGAASVERAMAETGLPRARLEAERGRPCGQPRLFAQVVRDGGFHDARTDPKMPDH